MIKPLSVVLMACFLLSSCASTSKQELSKEEKSKMFIEMASANLNEGDPTSALIYLKQALETSPNLPEIHYLLSLTYLHKNEIGLATRSAQRAIQLAPSFSAAKNTLGKIYLDSGRLPEAEKYLKEAAQDLTYRESFIAKTNLGYLFNKKLNQSEAERWYTKAIYDGGDSACMASYYRGQLYLDKNHLDKANMDFTRASKKGCAQFAEAHLAVGKTLLRMKKFDQARAKLIEVQQLFPSSEASYKASDYMREIP